MKTAKYEHQATIVKDDPKRAGLFLGTGSGKTRIALLLGEKRTRVICPKTQAEDGNWEREYEHISFTEEDRIDRLDVISKETFRRDAEELPGCDTLIIDEAHTCLGVTPNTRQRKRQIIPKASQLYEALDAYIDRVKPKRIYLCTATIMRSPMTVWAAGQILRMPEIVGDFYAFRAEYYVRLPMPGREVWQAKSDDKTKDKLAKLVKRLGYVGRLEDFFDVPPQTFKTDYIELTEEQKKRIKQMKMEYPEPIVRIGKVNQIENGVLAGDEFNVKEIFLNNKSQKILDYALEFPRMVIFCKYRGQIIDIQHELMIKGYNVMTLTGDTKDRGAVIAAANKAKACIFIAQSQISAGWELPDYPVMIFASRTYSFVDYVQALGRIQRANNIKKNLYINLVVRGGVDEAIDRALTNKVDFDDRLYADI